MSKLSSSLKALVNAPFARPGPVAAPRHIDQLFSGIAKDAASRNISPRSWLAISTATTFTLNSPDSLTSLFQAASAAAPEGLGDGVKAAEFMREVGLKCISFNGIPRSINCLNAFYASLPADVASRLSTTPTRQFTSANIEAAIQRGRGLWDSVYRPFEKKLFDKLAQSHPDLPVFILNGNYAGLLSDPEERGDLASVGRIHTSLVAISCLRSQTGVGPQVLSHVFGLRKALDDGSWRKDRDGESEEAVKWLASDEGSQWILNTVDKIVEAVGGSSFAVSGQPESKL
ncbi:hypothetical protein NLU13_4104 [Sarocladium strictum]|uniref:Dol-P-Man:Man(5)GlcNAc(2)-PP-Dol alpha-1,3-mannosyltransferase n=1 Tax=Sarocladium strictum TaxID=5046 RepID=A0AA39L8L4_SARSR|nr:hypothetical protein NLU13_4104 [Sarocladium strictum]